MVKIKKINLKEIKKLMRGLPAKMGKNAFWTFMVLFFLCLLLAAFVFYLNYWSIEKGEVEETGKEFKFKSEVYDKILEIWGQREERLNKTGPKQYPNIFLP